MEKTKSITLQNEIDPKTGLVLIKDYNSVKWQTNWPT